MIAVDLSSDMRADIDCAARSRAHVLVSGATADVRLGVARHVHGASGCAPSSFVIEPRVDRWPSMHATVFIEELGALADREQRLIVQWLDAPSRRRDVRLIAGTAWCASELIGPRRFDPVLFYRVNTIHIALPTGPRSWPCPLSQP